MVFTLFLPFLFACDSFSLKKDCTLETVLKPSELSLPLSPPKEGERYSVWKTVSLGFCSFVGCLVFFACLAGVYGLWNNIEEIIYIYREKVCENNIQEKGAEIRTTERINCFQLLYDLISYSRGLLTPHSTVCTVVSWNCHHWGLDLIHGNVCTHISTDNLLSECWSLSIQLRACLKLGYLVGLEFMRFRCNDFLCSTKC